MATFLCGCPHHGCVCAALGTGVSLLGFNFHRLFPSRLFLSHMLTAAALAGTRGLEMTWPRVPQNSHFTKCCEAHQGCASLRDTVWVPCTRCAHCPCIPVTPLPRDIPGVAHPHLEVEWREAVGVPIRFRSKITTDRRDPQTGLGRDPRAWAPSPAVAAAGTARQLCRALRGSGRRRLRSPGSSLGQLHFHFSRLSLAWMSLIAQRSASPSPGPRVRGTPGRNLTQTRVIWDQCWGPGNCNGHQPKYTGCPPR